MTELETQNWYYVRDRKKVGPVPWRQLRTLAASGQLRPADMVLPEGTIHWTEARSVPGLFPPLALRISDSPTHSQAVLADPLPTAVPLTGAPESVPAVPTVPGYVIRNELGRGGMGVVYLAEQVALKRLVALKMVLGGVVAGPQQLERFRAEAEAIARLQNPNIVQVHEVGERDGLPFFSLEYCAGGSLAQRLDGTPLPAREAAALVETLARAMHAAHERGIVHRDLKPANILYTSDGTAKITDFGLAKDLDATAKLTQSGAIMGTPSYMPPEQALGRIRELGPAADIYALGAILYELLTGRPPFKGATPMDTMMQAAKDEPVAPSRLQPKVPLDVETICLKCLEKSAGRRYATAQALADDLHRFLAHEPIHARPAGWVERCHKWARRRPATAALVVVSMFALLTVLFGGLYFTVQLGQQRNSALAQKARAEQNEAAAKQQEAKAESERKRAEDNERKATGELEKARRSLYTANMWRVAGLVERDPLQALELLRDRQTFPPDLHDFSWRYFNGLCANWRPGVLTVYRRNAGNVEVAIAISPDGATLAAGGAADGSIGLWDLPSRKAKTRLAGHTRPVHAVAFSPDGKTLASGSDDRTIKIWDLATGQPAGAALAGHTGTVRTLAFSPDGKRLVSGSGNLDPKEKDENKRLKHGEVRLWDVAAGKEERLLLPRQVAAVYCIAFSSDGRTIVAGLANDGDLFQFDALTDATRRFKYKGAWIQALSFSPDGRTLAIGTAMHVVHLHDVARCDRRATLGGHQFELESVTWAPDGKSLASGDMGGRIKLWNPITGQERLTLFGDSLVKSLAYTPNGTTLVAGHRSGKITIWELVPRSAWKTYPRLGLPGTGFGAVAVTPDGRTVAATAREKGAVRLWDLASDQERALSIGKNIGRALAFSPKGDVLAVGVQTSSGGTQFKPGGECQLWDVRADKKLATLKAADQAVPAVVFTHDGRTLITGDESGKVWLWDLAHPQATAFPLGTHEGPVLALALSPDGRTLASGGGAAIKLWDLAWRNERAILQGHSGQVTGLCYLDDGRTLLSGGSDQNVRLWDVAGKPQLRTSFSGQHDAILGLAVSKDEQTLALACQDRTIKIWDLPSKQLRAVLSGHTREVNGVVFSRDGRLLISASASNARFQGGYGVLAGEVKVWKAEP